MAMSGAMRAVRWGVFHNQAHRQCGRFAFAIGVIGKKGFEVIENDLHPLRGGRAEKINGFSRHDFKSLSIGRDGD